MQSHYIYIHLVVIVSVVFLLYFCLASFLLSINITLSHVTHISTLMYFFPHFSLHKHQHIIYI